MKDLKPISLVPTEPAWYAGGWRAAVATMLKGDRRSPNPGGDQAVDRDRRSGVDRRSSERIAVCFEVDYGADDTFLFAYITDISAMGIFVRTMTPEPPGTRLTLRFTPPGGEPLEFEGEVIWINPPRPENVDENRNPGMGIQFVELSPEQRDEVLQLVRTFAYLDDDRASDRD